MQKIVLTWTAVRVIASVWVVNGTVKLRVVIEILIHALVIVLIVGVHRCSCFKFPHSIVMVQLLVAQQQKITLLYWKIPVLQIKSANPTTRAATNSEKVVHF